MKLPEYSLKKEVVYSEDIKFPGGTLIQPIWNEDFLPEHIYQELKDIKRLRFDQKQYIMCIIGTKWIAVEPENIRRTQ